jgi:hypothetical protein
MGVDEQALLILELFDLTDEQYSEIISKWSGNEYEDDWNGYQTSIADLLSMCRWESMNDEQRGQEESRLAQNIGVWQ